jgi:hypothetical protein
MDYGQNCDIYAASKSSNPFKLKTHWAEHKTLCCLRDRSQLMPCYVWSCRRGGYEEWGGGESNFL